MPSTMMEDHTVRARYPIALLTPALLLLGLSLLTIQTAFAEGTPDGETPANEGVCDDLMFATPGLYGLCVAFCEAQDCEPDFSLDDPFEQCTPSSPKVLKAYDRRKGEDDPEMPCVQQTGCPCWSPEELAALPFPGEIEGGRPVCDHVEGMLSGDEWLVLTPRIGFFILLQTSCRRLKMKELRTLPSWSVDTYRMLSSRLCRGVLLSLTTSTLPVPPT